MESKKTINKFESYNQIFIAAIASVNYFDLLKYLKPKLQRKNLCFPKGTTFHLLAGIHHQEGGKPGRTDPSLLSQFYHTLLKYLQNICGNDDCKQCQKLITTKPCSQSIWKDMDYHLNLIPIDTVLQECVDAKGESYGLSEKSKESLKDLSKDLCYQGKEEAKQSSLIFASCYSIYSNITDLLRANGILTIMNISKDKGEVTEGKAFHLDPQQRDIIRRLSQDVSNLGPYLFELYELFSCFQSKKKPKNMIITGSAGTGKTLLVTEGLKMKVAQYKQDGVPVKIILVVCNGTSCPQLHQEMYHKYNTGYLMNEYNFNPTTIDELELSPGNVVFRAF